MSFFGGKLEEWLRTLRKKNAAVWLATQSLDDLRRSDYRSVILESCPSKIYLPNPEATTANIAEIYRDFGLSDRQIEIIGEAVPKREYYLVSPKGRRLFDLALEPIALSFVGASSKEHLRRARELISAHDENWPAYWLRERGLPQAAGELTPLSTQPNASARLRQRCGRLFLTRCHRGQRHVVKLRDDRTKDIASFALLISREGEGLMCLPPPCPSGSGRGGFMRSYLIVAAAVLLTTSTATAQFPGITLPGGTTEALTPLPAVPWTAPPGSVDDYVTENNSDVSATSETQTGMAGGFNANLTFGGRP